MNTNWDLHDFEGRNVIFIGRGREGLSFETFIKKHGKINSFLFIDQQDDPDYLESLRSIDTNQTIVVKTAGCPGRLVPTSYTTPTKIFFELIRQLGATTVGITGTKGKTTTTSLIDAMLKAGGKPSIIAGNIGKPMLDYLDEATPESIFVLELSSYQLAELEVSPHVGVLTNLYNDHTDYHGSLELYWEAKHNIMKFMGPNDTFIYNPLFETAKKWVQTAECKLVAIDEREKVDMSKTGLIGEHNRHNASMAFAAAEAMGVDRATAQAALDVFQPVRHRLQKVRTVRGVIFVDDAIGSQPEATEAGISALIKEVAPVGCVMLGGQDRGYEYDGLMELLVRIGVPNLVLFPDTGERFKNEWPEGPRPEMYETRDMKEAVKWAAEHTPAGSICLLSSAAPSYSLWKDFEEKGDQFQEAVNQL